MALVQDKKEFDNPSFEILACIQNLAYGRFQNITNHVSQGTTNVHVTMLSGTIAKCAKPWEIVSARRHLPEAPLRSPPPASPPGGFDGRTLGLGEAPAKIACLVD